MRVDRALVLAGILVIASASSSNAQMPSPGGAYPPQSPYIAASAYQGMHPAMAPPTMHPAEQVYWAQQAAYAQQMAASQAAVQQTVNEYESLADPTVNCASCDGGGCQGCYGTGHALSWWNSHGPQGDGKCCTPRWFDLSVELFTLKRDNVSRTVNFTSDGIAGIAPPNIVLSTDNLSFNDEDAEGVRVTLCTILGPGSNLEVTYFGFQNFATSASATSGTKNLFSAFSEFGNNPFNGYSDTGQASYHGIEYSSLLDSVELNIRHRWSSENCRFHGSKLIGMRYVRLDEELLFKTRGAGVDPATLADLNQSMNYLTFAQNDLVGFQVGGDLFFSAMPGLRIGADIDGGIYGNCASQDTSILSSTVNPEQREVKSRTEAALVAETNFAVVYSVNSRLTLRAGYTLFYMNGVALGPENFNAIAPQLGPRTPAINVDGTVFYHGYNGGIEWTW